MSDATAFGITVSDTPASAEDYLDELVGYLREQDLQPLVSTTEGLSTVRWQIEAGSAEVYIEDAASRVLYVLRTSDGETHKAHFMLGTPPEELTITTSDT